MSYEATKLGDVIRNRRLELGLTQKELEQRAGLHQEWVSMVERGRVKHPRTTHLQRLADALDMDARDLVVAASYTKSRQAAEQLLIDDTLPEMVVEAMQAMRGLSAQAQVQFRNLIVMAAEHERQAEEKEREPV